MINIPFFGSKLPADDKPDLTFKDEKEVSKFLDEIDPHTRKGQTAYRGNTLLKKAGETIEFTKEMVSEYIKCSEDPIYFIEKYVKIIHPDKGKVPFILRDYQRDMIMSMWKYRRTIIATARQVGKSTTTCAFILWFILFNRHKTVALLANKGETAREILSRVKLAYSLLPKWLQSGIVEGGWNKGSILLENGSCIFAAATSSDAIRGYVINLLFLDEAAFVEGWEEFESSVMPTISASETSKVIMVSTPNGMNHFNKYYVLANRSQDAEDWNGYHPIRVSWEQVPGRDQKWYKDTLATMSGNLDKFNQEYGVEFLGSSDTLIAGWKLKELVHQTPVRYDRGLSQYHLPEKDRIYILTADVSHGKGFDDSAFHVIDITEMPYQIVCSYKSNQITPSEYADIIQRTGQTYNKAFVLVECNDIGAVVTQLLQADFEYENLLYTKNSGRGGITLTAGFGDGNSEVGMRTSIKTKIVGCSLLKVFIEQNQLLIDDFHTIEELSTFIKKNTSYAADEGKKDDLVMALVIFAWATDQPLFKDLVSHNPIELIRDLSDEELEAQLTPFGISDYDADQEANSEMLKRTEDHWSLYWKEDQEFVRDIEDHSLADIIDASGTHLKYLSGEWVNA